MISIMPNEDLLLPVEDIKMVCNLDFFFENIKNDNSPYKLMCRIDREVHRSVVITKNNEVFPSTFKATTIERRISSAQSKR